MHDDVNLGGAIHPPNTMNAKLKQAVAAYKRYQLGPVDLFLEARESLIKAAIEAVEPVKLTVQAEAIAFARGASDRARMESHDF